MDLRPSRSVFLTNVACLTFMKLISLNLWCGIKYEALKIFLEQRSKDIDIFCFQEVRDGEYMNQAGTENERVSLFSDIQNILTDFSGHFTEMVPGVGMATYIRTSVPIEKVESKYILTAAEIAHIKMEDGNSYYPRIMQSIYLKDRDLVVHNFHGIPGNSKMDTPERELQTSNLLEAINNIPKPQIIVGDFNLDINTSAILKLSARLKNLIKESKFKTTRNRNYNKIDVLPYADYAFVSQDIKINSFEVLSDEVSDHLALLLDFV